MAPGETGKGGKRHPRIVSPFTPRGAPSREINTSKVKRRKSKVNKNVSGKAGALCGSDKYPSAQESRFLNKPPILC
jgi:hypothetical protein